MKTTQVKSGAFVCQSPVCFVKVTQLYGCGCVCVVLSTYTSGNYRGWLSLNVVKEADSLPKHT